MLCIKSNRMGPTGAVNLQRFCSRHRFHCFQEIIFPQRFSRLNYGSQAGFEYFILNRYGVIIPADGLVNLVMRLPTFPGKMNFKILETAVIQGLTESDDSGFPGSCSLSNLRYGLMDYAFDVTLNIICYFFFRIPEVLVEAADPNQSSWLGRKIRNFLSHGISIACVEIFYKYYFIFGTFFHERWCCSALSQGKP